LIELMIVVCIMAVLTVLIIREYQKHIVDAYDKRVRFDLQELAKTIAIYNLRESQPFSDTTFRPPFIGNYLSSAPTDPWGRGYRHNFELGVLYSLGSNGTDDTATPSLGTASGPDDIVFQYLPAEFFIRKAEIVDANHNQRLDFGDRLRIIFSRTARLDKVQSFDFITRDPERALGNLMVLPHGNAGLALEFMFAPPVDPRIDVGRTHLGIRPLLDTVVDYSNPPKSLDPDVWVPIQWAK